LCDIEEFPNLAKYDHDIRYDATVYALKDIIIEFSEIADRSKNNANNSNEVFDVKNVTSFRMNGVTDANWDETIKFFVDTVVDFKTKLKIN
jgi:hypothetical protein